MENMENQEKFFQETLNTIATNAVTNKVAYYADLFRLYDDNKNTLKENIERFASSVIENRSKNFLEETSKQFKISDSQKLSFEVADFSTYKATFGLENKCGFIYDKIEHFSLQATNDHIKELGINGFVSINHDKEKTEEKSYILITIKNLSNALLFPIIINEIMHFFKTDIQNRLNTLLKKIQDKFNKDDIIIFATMIYLLSSKSNFSQFYSQNKENLNLYNLIKDPSKWLTLNN